MASKLGRFFTSMIIERSAPRLGLSSELSSIAMSRLVHSSTRVLQNQQDAAAPPPQHKEEEDQSATRTTDVEEEDEDGGGEPVNKETGEIGGPRGPEPTRFGDWEQKGRCTDF